MTSARPLGWLGLRGDPQRVNATQFTIGELPGGDTADILASGRQIRVRVVGTTAWTDTIAVRTFATGGAAMRATVTVFGLYDLPGTGTEALEIEWLEDSAGLEPSSLHVYGAHAVTRTVPTGWTLYLHTASLTGLTLAAAIGAEIGPAPARPVRYLSAAGNVVTTKPKAERVEGVR